MPVSHDLEGARRCDHGSYGRAGAAFDLTALFPYERDLICEEVADFDEPGVVGVRVSGEDSLRFGRDGKAADARSEVCASGVAAEEGVIDVHLECWWKEERGCEQE